MGPLLFPDQSFKKDRAPQPEPRQASPMSMLDQMDERHGKLKSRLGLFSHLYNGGSRSDYGDEDMLAAQKSRQAQQAMQDKMGMAQPLIEMMQSNDPRKQMEAMYGLEQLGFSDKMMEMAMPGYSASSATELPEATRAAIHYQDSLNRYVDPETGEVKTRQMGDKGYVKYSDAYDQYKNRELEGLRGQAAAKAEGSSLGSHAAEIENKAPSEAATMQSAMNAIENMGGITFDEDGMPVFTPSAEYAEDFEDVYGTLDQFKPVPFSTGEAFINASIEQLQGILAVDARGKLKGQGQISDSETRMLEKSLTILQTKGISPKKAREEIARIYYVMQKGMRQKEEIMNPTQGNQGAPAKGSASPVPEGLGIDQSVWDAMSEEDRALWN